MPYNSRAFGAVIARIRTEKGLTQEALSGLAGIARSHLVMVENGRKTVRLDTLWRLAEALRIRASDLIRLTEQETGEGRT
ncbi:MAG: helix-turn-helix transcriptional regulator [Clostridia bacterium]|nr:helix-turn-helix transcriptional regulator [Clostridia bacterium]